MALSRIVLRLARNPGGPFSEGDDERGYAFVAQLTGEGKPDTAALGQGGEDGSARRFVSGEDPVEGRLVRTGDGWAFDFGDGAGDQPVYRLGDHRFVVGEYVTVTDEDGEPLTYKVAEVAGA